MVFWGTVNQSSLGIGWKPWETVALGHRPRSTV